jgi:hypothetical protein
MEFGNLEQVEMSNCRRGNKPLDWQKKGVYRQGREAVEELILGLSHSRWALTRRLCRDRV